MSVDVVRDAAVNVLLAVFERGAFLSVALDRSLRRKGLSERGGRFLTQLVYGTVRHKLLCDHVLAPLLKQPLDKLPGPIHAILRMGVFQALFCNQVTFPAMVHTSVDLAKKHGHMGTSRLVNAVLKRVPQCLEDVRFPDEERNPVRGLSVRHSIPAWLVERWVAQFGLETARELCEASNRQAPVTLRTNVLKSSRDELAQRLDKAGVQTLKTTPVPEELTVVEGGNPLKTKLFLNGHFMLQDPASMLPPHLMEPRPGEKILDVCAAPGGKTAHLAELAGGKAVIVANDVSPLRLSQVQENCSRLGTPAVRVLCSDGAALPFSGGFAGVLLDAPCTGLGTLRRHPDLKWRAQATDAARMAAQQRALLRAACRLCDNGGRVVYSVCTFTPEETTAHEDFVKALGDMDLEDGPEWMNQWKIGTGQYRTLPQKGALDGFFLMRLRKVS